jgi:DNA-binding GntR family transcriptional regulator
MLSRTVLEPVPRTPGDHATSVVHAHLRRLILDGVLQPGELLNQVRLASELGVSRTPIREAIRMLQEEALVHAEAQKQARVVGFDPGHLESVYTQRVLLEGLAVSLTAPRADADQIARLEKALHDLDQPPEQREGPEWRAVHRRFHIELVSGAPPHLIDAITSNMDRGERYRLNYRLMYEATGTRGWDTSPSEHRAIVETFRHHDGRGAAGELAAHLARTALLLAAQLAPTYEPRALRAALSLMGGAHGHGRSHDGESVGRRADAARHVERRG